MVVLYNIYQGGRKGGGGGVQRVTVVAPLDFGGCTLLAPLEIQLLVMENTGNLNNQDSISQCTPPPHSTWNYSTSTSNHLPTLFIEINIVI